MEGEREKEEKEKEGERRSRRVGGGGRRKEEGLHYRGSVFHRVINRLVFFLQKLNLIINQQWTGSCSRAETFRMETAQVARAFTGESLTTRTSF